MGMVIDAIDEERHERIARQRMFFVATAPTGVARGPDAIEAYKVEQHTLSIDGLPAVG